MPSHSISNLCTPLPTNLYTLLLPSPPSSSFLSSYLQTHSNSHTITMHHQHRRAPLTKHLQIPQIPRTSLHALTCSLDGTRQRRKHNRRILTLTPHQLIQYQMLRPTWEIIERNRYPLSTVCGTTTRLGMGRGVGRFGGLGNVI
jgi:hypothetical protein